MEYVRVEIVSLSLVPSGGGTCAIVLREVDGERFLPVIIGLLEAQSIAVKVQGLPTPRPLTHDLMSKLLTEMGAEITRVAIESLSEGTFYGSISIKRGGDESKIDSRPSDAIGLAVRTGAPIFVSENVMREAAATPENGLPEENDSAIPDVERDEPAPPARKLSPREQLEDQLKAAIKEEDYERAAELRDEIKRLSSEQSN